MKLHIKEIRQAMGLSIRELSKRCGVSVGYISDLENGVNNNPSLKQICKLAKALEVEVYKLFEC